MAVICPTVTAKDKVEYLSQLKTASGLFNRVHIDVSDGTIAPRELLPFGRMRWAKNVKSDIHLMVKHPDADIAIALELKPHLVILHAEAAGDLLKAVKRLHRAGIKAGVALLKPSQPGLISDIVLELDHVMIFSGNLGYQGHSLADLKLLNKISVLKKMNPRLEIGWDGGVNNYNIEHLVQGGVDVVNVGGFIHYANSPEKAYAKLKLALRT